MTMSSESHSSKEEAMARFKAVKPMPELFQEMEVTPSELEKRLTNGCTCSFSLFMIDEVLRRKTGCKEKMIPRSNIAGEYWVSSQVVAIDVDGADLDLEAFLETQVTVQPNVSHGSFHYQQDGKYRYHLFYFLPKPVETKAAFLDIYERIVSTVVRDCPEIENAIDKHMRNVSQLLFGTTEDKPSHHDNRPLDLSTLVQVPHHSETELLTIPSMETEDGDSTSSEPLKTEENYRFIGELYHHKSSDFLEMYKGQFKIWEQEDCSAQPTWEEPGLWFGLTFLTLRRAYRRAKEGEGFPVHRWMNHENRHSKLYTACLVKRLCNPKITLKELLYNMVYERYYFYNNQDHKFTNRYLLILSVRILTLSEEKLKEARLVQQEYARQLKRKQKKTNRIAVSDCCDLVINEEAAKANGVTNISKHRSRAAAIIRNARKLRIMQDCWDAGLLTGEYIEKLKSHGVSYHSYYELHHCFEAIVKPLMGMGQEVSFLQLVHAAAYGAHPHWAKDIYRPMGKKRKNETDARRLWDQKLSNRENIQRLVDTGVTERTAYRWAEEHMLLKKNKPEDVRRLLEEGKNTEEIMEQLDISRATLYRLKKKLKEGKTE